MSYKPSRLIALAKPFHSPLRTSLLPIFVGPAVIAPRSPSSQPPLRLYRPLLPPSRKASIPSRCPCLLERLACGLCATGIDHRPLTSVAWSLPSLHHADTVELTPLAACLPPLWSLCHFLRLPKGFERVSTFRSNTWVYITDHPHPPHPII